MGYANAQRLLNYIRIFAEFISQPEYVNVVPMFGLLNEPLVGIIGKETLTSLCVVVFFLDLGLGLAVNAHSIATCKPIGSFVKSQVLVKAKVLGSRLAMVLAASQFGLTYCPMPIDSLWIPTPTSRLVVVPTPSPSTSQHQMVRWEVSGQGWLARPGNP